MKIFEYWSNGYDPANKRSIEPIQNLKEVAKVARIWKETALKLSQDPEKALLSRQLLCCSHLSRGLADALERPNPEIEFYASKEAESIVGLLQVRKEEKTLWIDRLVVDPSKMKQGIGSFLLKHIETIASQNRITEISLFPSDTAYWFYFGLGYSFSLDHKQCVEGYLSKKLEDSELIYSAG